jgi:hypothetical protein
MKNIQKSLFLFFILISAVSNAQDYIRTDKDTIQAKVIEIGLDEIKYKNFNNLDGPVIVIEKEKVREITYENGTKYLIKDDPYNVNKEIEVRGKTHSIKFELFSPTTNDLVFGYERMLSVGKNLEFKVGIIGIGNKNYEGNASGASLKVGFKFLTSPQYVSNGLKYVHPLKGRYIKPEIILNSYSEDVYYSSNTLPYTTDLEKIQRSNIAFAINFGTQHILGNIMTLDYYIGIGYGFRITSDEPDNSYTIYNDGDGDYAYSHIYMGTSSIILTGGFTIGGLF